jgi:hypothetical protein
MDDRPDRYGHVADMNRILADIGLQLSMPRQRPAGKAAPKAAPKAAQMAADAVGQQAGEPAAIHPDTGTRVAELSATPNGPMPVAIDAWTALQRLRMSNTDLARHVALEHLLFASELSWSGVEGAYTPSRPGGTAASESYIRSRSGGRLPVVLFMAEPPPREDKAVRRPVVAVLDTGVAPHRWLEGSLDAVPNGPFVMVDAALQDALARRANGPRLTSTGLTSFNEEQIEPPETLVGELDSHWGHGTFIAGIIRQAAPNARVLMIRVMYSDGVAHEGDVLFALDRIIARVRDAQRQGGDPDSMVDVVSLSLGYYPEDDDPARQSVTNRIDQLIDMGVIVVAAAGNDTTTQRFYPAALAARRPNKLRTKWQQVVSVGSLNPNRSKAFFSNDGPWVRRWAPGASVVSTFPQNATGSIGPINIRNATAPASLPKRREALDEDDFSSGFAVWNGTSFAAPLVAAKLAETLFDQSEAEPNAAAAPGHIDVDGTRAAAAKAVEELGAFVWPQYRKDGQA